MLSGTVKEERFGRSSCSVAIYSAQWQSIVESYNWQTILILKDVSSRVWQGASAGNICRGVHDSLPVTQWIQDSLPVPWSGMSEDRKRPRCTVFYSDVAGYLGSGVG